MTERENEKKLRTMEICERFSAGLLLFAAAGSRLAGEWERLTILRFNRLNGISSIGILCDLTLIVIRLL